MSEEERKSNIIKSGINKVTRGFGEGSFPNGLAIILILGTIIAIILMIVFYQSTITYNQNLYKDIVNRTITNGSAEDILDSFQIFYRESNASNTNLLSILLPVFGTWVGAILAFYYGNKNFEKTIDALSTSADESEKLRNLKIKDILEQFPNYKKVNKAKISDDIGKSFEGIGNQSSLLLTTDDGNTPMGFFYKEEILKQENMDETKIKTIGKSFKEYFTEMDNAGKPIIDEITGQKWSSESKITNYAEININDTLLQARSRMKSISDKQKVRGLVLSNEKQIIGIITYDLFSEVLAKEQTVKSS
jgi:hypothetical protein